MLSQQDMEDFMNVEAVLKDRDEDASKPEAPSSTILGGTSAGDEVRTVPDLQRIQQD
jgi:hypothetical protein